MPRDRERGFTLIEILVAFAIAAILLIPLLRSFASGADSAARADAYTEATLIAQSTLATLGPEVPIAAGSGIDRQEGPYHITASVRQYGNSVVGKNTGPQLVPYAVVVKVGWHEAGKSRSVSLQTLRFGLSPSERRDR